MRRYAVGIVLYCIVSYHVLYCTSTEYTCRTQVFRYALTPEPLSAPWRRSVSDPRTPSPISGFTPLCPPPSLPVQSSSGSNCPAQRGLLPAIVSKNAHPHKVDGMQFLATTLGCLSFVFSSSLPHHQLQLFRHSFHPLLFVALRLVYL